MNQQHPVVAELAGADRLCVQPFEVLNVPPSPPADWIRDICRARVEQHLRDVVKGLVTLRRPLEADRARDVAVLAGQAAQMRDPR